MEETKLDEKIVESLHKSVYDAGYEIIRVKFLVIDQDNTLQIMIDRLTGDREIDVKDCAKVSRIASAILDIDNIIEDKYNLEVSSPGIDRPLTKMKDYIIFKGFEAKFNVNNLSDETKKFKAKILEAEENKIKLRMLNNLEEIEIDFDQIVSAQLILTDELMKFSKERYSKK